MRKSPILALIAAIAIIAATGCTGGNAPSPSTAKAAAQNLVYSKDARTGLCFGSISNISSASGFDVVSIITVPCEKVEHLPVK